MTHIVVIGGGIVGIATALALQKTQPHIRVTVLEKESNLACHQTGRNSGVIHAGIYYTPNTLKADFCYRGSHATIDFCQQHQLSFEQCGKLLVATNLAELQRMDALYDRAISNGVTIEKLSQAALKEREPNITGIGALFSPHTGIVNYAMVTEKMADIFVERGGEIVCQSQVKALSESQQTVTITTQLDEIVCQYVIACGGLMADRLAKMAGIGDDFSIIPFQGKYYRLAEQYNQIVNHLIYPIPDPEMPFLGIHLTRMVGGYVTVGPNASLVLSREGYLHQKINLTDIKDMLVFPGFWRSICHHFRYGVQEMLNTYSRHHYLSACQKYYPSLTVADLLPHPSGVRAQAVMADGTLVDDFLIRQTQRSIHLCNAPSPAATSAIPIAEHIVSLAEKKFSLASQ
ncbi:MAG: L-2-hydroxyglutarate oxidase [Ostreibacterium sp.]